MKIGIDQIEGLAEALAGAGGGSGFPGSRITFDPGNAYGIIVSAGKQKDSTGEVTIALPVAMRKSVAGLWALGENQNGRAEDPRRLSYGYHAFVIYNATTKAVDVLLSTSAANPPLPAGFTHFRRLGGFMVDGGGTVRPFRQWGRRFDLVTPITDYANQANGGSVAILRKVSVPQGRKMEARVFFHSTGNIDSTYSSGLYDPDLGLPPQLGTPTQFANIVRRPLQVNTLGYNSYERIITNVLTDANAQIYTYSNDPGDTIVVRILGWQDGIDELI